MCLPSKLSGENSADGVDFGGAGLRVLSSELMSRADGADSDIEIITGNGSMDIMKGSNCYNRANFTKLINVIRDRIENKRAPELDTKFFDKFSKINNTLTDATAKMLPFPEDAVTEANVEKALKKASEYGDAYHILSVRVADYVKKYKLNYRS